MKAPVLDPAPEAGDSDDAPLPRSTAEEPLVEKLKHEARVNGPGVLASLGLHLVLLFLLGLVVIARPKAPPLPATIGAWVLDGPNTGKKPGRPEPVKVDAITIDPVPAAAPAKSSAKDEPAAGAPAMKEGPGPGPNLNPQQVNVGGSLEGRGKGGKGSALAAGGGNQKTEQTVSLGLGWLARQQNKADGRWQLHEGYPDAGDPGLRTDTGATALALLALLGSGQTHKEGTHQKVIDRGLNWLIKVQKPNGDLHDWTEEGRQTSFYAHGQATIALCEAYAMTRDSALLEPAQKALGYIYESQHPVSGGWKYRPRSEGDLSVFGWQLMAIESARMAGLTVPQEVLDRASVFIDLVQEQDGARYKYSTEEGVHVTPAMTAEGLLCREYLGWPRNHPALLAGAAFLVEPQNLPQWNGGRRNVYFWYYATQTLHNLQGPEWEKWNSVLRDELTKSQVKSGKQGGSWHPRQPSGDPQENADKAGRLYITALCTMMMEVYYRHLPLYGSSAAAVN